MKWQLQYLAQAEKELSKLDRAVQRSLVKYLLECCELPDPASRGHALTGPYAGYHRYRIGQLRVIVELQRQVITILVITINRRDSIYK